MQKSLDICLMDKMIQKDYDYKCVYNPKIIWLSKNDP
jgi:hypothetical protein